MPMERVDRPAEAIGRKKKMDLLGWKHAQVGIETTDFASEFSARNDCQTLRTPPGHYQI